MINAYLPLSGAGVSECAGRGSSDAMYCSSASDAMSPIRKITMLNTRTAFRLRPDRERLAFICANCASRDLSN